MQTYLRQLHSDITYAAENVSWPFAVTDSDIHDWISPTEEDETAPVINLQDWTGIRQEQLPPAQMLGDEQLQQLLTALKKMLDAYNWSFVLQTEVPERIQYEAIRLNFNQPAKQKRWHMGFFEYCTEGTEHGKCTLGKYCQCAFYAGFFSDFIDEELSPEEERTRELEIEVNHLKRKHGDDWMKYYPYHLDAEYDDENGKPYNHGFDDERDDEEDDDWWRK